LSEFDYLATTRKKRCAKKLLASFKFRLYACISVLG